ncbi:MAG: DUF421 domain-containing protein [Candidatus Cohnella colombiensis]|uniref:DUF421 domain-containing protein n=1 Tax=Candidatus Cohnella colombiensis TaxID=3121368 RepID=A0AA95JCE2_9BACL|nr:MAG: DUF421 domain-containing protein [Cohnella sp.]
MPTWIEVTLRTFAAVAVLFVLTRLLGKRQVSQLSLFEYITGITIGSIAAFVSLEADETWFRGLISLIVWSAVSLGIEFLQLKSKKARDMLDGKAAVLIQHGKVLENNMKKERITSDELLELLRMKDVFNISQVEAAIMDTSGELNVLLKKEYQPLTPSDIKLPVTEEKIPMTIIMDGKVLEDSLRKVGLNVNWLNAELEHLKLSTNEIFLAQVDSQNQLYVDRYEDHIQQH